MPKEDGESDERRKKMVHNDFHENCYNESCTVMTIMKNAAVHLAFHYNAHDKCFHLFL